MRDFLKDVRGSSLFKILQPEKIKTFGVTVAMCTHRGVSISVIKRIKMLESCPRPKITFRLLEGDALIERSRARVATEFLLNTNDDILIFLDDDILIAPKDVQKLALVCKEKDLDILGAAYVTKDEDNPAFTFRTLANEEDIPFGTNGGLNEIRMQATGCIAIQRRVFQEMVERGDAVLCNNQNLQFYPFFTPMTRMIDRHPVYLSEDWAFCERARELGFKVWLDTTIKVGHIGPKVYDWDDLSREKKEKKNNFDYLVRIKE